MDQPPFATSEPDSTPVEPVAPAGVPAWPPSAAWPPPAEAPTDPAAWPPSAAWPRSAASPPPAEAPAGPAAWSPAERQSPAEAPAGPAAWSQPAAWPPSAEGPAQPTSSPPDRPARTAGVRLVVLAAVLAAVLSSGLTFAVLQVGMPGPAASAAPTAAAATPASPPAQGSSASVGGVAVATRVAADAAASVVTIATEQAGVFDPFTGSAGSTGSGSGFVVSADGLILTNNHVINGASTIDVTFEDGRQLAATVVTTDAQHDLALVRVNATGLTPLALGDSSALIVGEVAIAIGSPLGTFSDTTTQGIVSGLGRSIDVRDGTSRRTIHLSGLIQTDAAINPGNSGGPLFDGAGKVIGIVTASASNSQGVGFAVPIAVALPLITAAAGS